MQAARGSGIGKNPGEVSRMWAAWFAAFFLVAVGWALLTPLNQYPDEADQVYRAVSVVRGEIIPHIGAYKDHTGAITNIPISLMLPFEPDRCRAIHGPGHCTTASAPPGWVTVATSEGRNFPLFYALVGWPSLLSANTTGWYLMRLAGACLCSLFLATGVLVILSMPRRPLVLTAAIAAGLTPLTLDLSGSDNPSGLEAAAAFCFWAVLLVFIRGSTFLPRRLLVVFGTISGIVLAMTRDLGWLWLICVILGSLASTRRFDRRAFLRSPAACVMLGGAFAAAIVAEAWVITFRAYQVFPSVYASNSLTDAALAAAKNTPLLLKEALAFLGPLTIPPPSAADVCWIAAAGAVIVICLLTSRRAGILALNGAALLVILPFTIQLATYLHPSLGTWQGRYDLPLAVGVPLLGIATTRTSRPERGIVAALALGAIALALAAQVAVYRGAVAAFVPSGVAPYGSAALLLGTLAVLANIAWVEARWSTSGREQVPSASLSEPQPETDSTAMRHDNAPG